MVFIYAKPQTNYARKLAFFECSILPAGACGTFGADTEIEPPPKVPGKVAPEDPMVP